MASAGATNSRADWLPPVERFWISVGISPANGRRSLLVATGIMRAIVKMIKAGINRRIIEQHWTPGR